jgi:hypothetical protein
VETVEEKSWKELDRYQTMTETEKKSFNNRQPSDPRRRRRSSGDTNSLTNSLKEDFGWIVSPNKHKPKSPSDSDSPVKKRNKKSSFSLTPTIQPKSSLLSIWTNHMSLSASRLHEEFEGRKNSLNGKYELYQKEPEEDATANNNNSQNVKEWV